MKRSRHRSADCRCFQPQSLQGAAGRSSAARRAAGRAGRRRLWADSAAASARRRAARRGEYPCLAPAALARRGADPARASRRRPRRPASRSCRWTRVSIPARCCRAIALAIAADDDAGTLARQACRARRARRSSARSPRSRPAGRGPCRSRRAGRTYARKIDKARDAPRLDAVRPPSSSARCALSALSRARTRCSSGEPVKIWRARVRGRPRRAGRRAARAGRGRDRLRRRCARGIGAAARRRPSVERGASSCAAIRLPAGARFA